MVVIRWGGRRGPSPSLRRWCCLRSSPRCSPSSRFPTPTATAAAMAGGAAAARAARTVRIWGPTERLLRVDRPRPQRAGRRRRGGRACGCGLIGRGGRRSSSATRAPSSGAPASPLGTSASSAPSSHTPPTSLEFSKLVMLFGLPFIISCGYLSAREKAMVINLEFVKAIITAEEVLLLDPLGHEVLPFVDQLRQQLTLKSPQKTHDSDIQGKKMGSPTGGQRLSVTGATEGDQSELPFEFQVLEIALEVVCTYLESSVADLEKDAYPCLDELAKNVSTKNLERVRGLKTDLTRLLARVQKVRDEIEHLLDDDEDMAHLYLTRKQIQNQQFEVLMAAGALDNTVAPVPNLRRFNSYHGTASFISVHSDDNNVEDLEMLLEAYFMQLDGTRNKILSVREYIDDTEDYVNIQLDNQRNELIQLQLTLTIASFAIALDTLIAGIFAMNIPCQLYNIDNIFGSFVGGTTSGCFFIFLLILSYARWKKLLGS